MNFSGLTLLVDNFDRCFKFYSQRMGFRLSWGKLGGEYASFDLGNNLGFSIYKSELMSATLGDLNKELPTNARDKITFSFKVDDVDVAFEDYKSKGVKFLSEPKDMTGWGMRVVHLRDPEGNLMEIFSELAREKWDQDLQQEAEEFGV